MKSIRFRLWCWFVVVFGLILGGFCGFLYLKQKQSRYQEADRLVQDKVMIVSSWIYTNQGNITRQIEQDFRPDTNQLRIQISDLKGRVLGKSLNLAGPLPLSEATRAEALAREEVVLETIRIEGGETVRLATYPRWGERDVIGFAQVGLTGTEIRRPLLELQRWLRVALPLTMAVLMAGAWLLINHLLRPLARMTRTAQRMNSETLSTERLEVVNPADELGQLAQTFNGLFDRLQKAFTLQQRFVADAAHELRTPLTALRGEIEVTLRKPRQPDDYREVLTSNLEEIDRLSALTSNLLLLARADAGESNPVRESCNLSEICRAVCGKLQTLADRNHIGLAVDGLPVLELAGDAEQLSRVVLNLVENALKYTPADGLVKVTLSQTDGQAKLTVSDTGCGIPAADLPFVFERFYRVDKARAREIGGTRLGLAITKSIIEAHQGRIEVTSPGKQGSVFTVWLPLGHVSDRLRK
ncbi:MAG: HAMP domain-containing protein [Blastocatellia bacterium]|nr:HAMP domain-containing protein [Blastocatellia bacterium]